MSIDEIVLRLFVAVMVGLPLAFILEILIARMLGALWSEELQMWLFPEDIERLKIKVKEDRHDDL